ncbi:hypothetical protein [Aquella oligotrophica]|uniref:Uncharacterized protein n=1 Tax=Aquella oligotrophica TaxID=2067065 RepID=A0A2I7N4Z9_9NEIS|nr:hypothetical protein [Aquella oligotrophica]AUR51546.1 hypothetical protein CUN60_04325 [Aquella oligotrophica]
MNEPANKFSEFLEMYDQLFALLNKEEEREKNLSILRRYFRYTLNTPNGDREIDFGGVIEGGTKLINSQFFLWKVREVLNYRVLHGLPLDELSRKIYEILGEFLQELISIIDQSNVIKFDGSRLVPLRKDKRVKFEYLRNVILCALFIVSKFWLKPISENDFQSIIFYIAALRAITRTEFNLLFDSNGFNPIFTLAGKKSYSARSEELPMKPILVMTITNEYLKYSVLDPGFSPRSFNDLVFDIGEDILDTYRKIMRGKNKAHCYFLESKGKIYKDFHKLIAKEVQDRLNEEQADAKKNNFDGFFWGKYKVALADSGTSSLDELFKTHHVVIKNGSLFYHKLDFKSPYRSSFMEIKEEKLKDFLNEFEYRDINCNDPLKIAKLLDKNVKVLSYHKYWMFPILAQRVYSCSETYCEISREIYSFIKNLKWNLKGNQEKLRLNMLKPIIESNYEKLNLLLDKHNL